MQCTKPIRLTKNLRPSEYPDGLMVPCGKCTACRIARRKEWTMRMLHELDAWDNAVFVTLTYDDEHLPQNSSLVKSDLQKFFKRLRKRLENESRKIKYFACGEYGDETFRPHYHAIIFGMSLKPEDKNIIIGCWPFCDWSNDTIRNKAFGLAEIDSIRYVAQYIDKKFTGEKADHEYTEKHRQPVFRLLSLSMGKEYALHNSVQLIENEGITLFGTNQSFPRYYLKLLGLEKSDFRKENAIERDRETVERITGVSDIGFEEFYKVGAHDEVKRLVSKIDQERIQINKNLNARIANNCLKKDSKL